MSIVFDASALLAALLEEPGGEAVAEFMGNGLISAVNAAEVAAVLVRTAPDSEVRAIFGDLQLDIVPPDEATALAAGLMARGTRSLGLSLGDRFCLALAVSRKLPVLTADRAWLSVAEAIGVEVRLIR